MLVLSRKAQQSIIINGEITVRIISVKGNTVRLGIEAPKEIPVRRNEIVERTHGLEQVAQPCAA